MIAGSLEDANAERIVQFALKNRLATIFPRVAFVISGGLMSYGADRNEPMKHVALTVDKILKGTKPADIPVEQPRKFELVINLKNAKQIGLTIPKIVLARADRVITNTRHNPHAQDVRGQLNNGNTEINQSNIAECNEIILRNCLIDCQFHKIRTRYRRGSYDDHEDQRNEYLTIIWLQEL